MKQQATRGAAEPWVQGHTLRENYLNKYRTRTTIQLRKILSPVLSRRVKVGQESMMEVLSSWKKKRLGANELVQMSSTWYKYDMVVALLHHDVSLRCVSTLFRRYYYPFRGLGSDPPHCSPIVWVARRVPCSLLVLALVGPTVALITALYYRFARRPTLPSLGSMISSPAL